MGILYTFIIGAVCGYIADALMGDRGYGLIVNIIIGIAGSFLGTWIFQELNIYFNTGYYWLNDIITGASGAIVILFVVSIIAGRRR